MSRAQTRTLDILSVRHGELIVAVLANGDLHVQPQWGRRAWIVVQDGRAVTTGRRGS